MPFSRILVLIIGLLGMVYFGIDAYQDTLKDSYDAGFKAAADACKEKNDAALLRAKDKIITNLQGQISLADQTVKTLRAEKADSAKKAAELKEEIDYVTTTWTPPNADKPEAQPACMFTNGFVRVYNSAFGASSELATGMPATGAATGIDRAPQTAATADTSLQPSSIERADILRHATQAGQQCQDTADQLNSLIDYLEEQGKLHANAG